MSTLTRDKAFVFFYFHNIFFLLCTRTIYEGTFYCSDLTPWTEINAQKNKWSVLIYKNSLKQWLILLDTFHSEMHLKLKYT